MNILDKTLQDGSKRLGLDLSAHQRQLFLIYAQELQKWNKKINLTAIVDEKEIALRHFLDSLSCLKVYSPANGDRVIDIGTGAGFPGIPLKIYNPRINLSLLESSQKKILFLKQLARLLNFPEITFLSERVENLAKKEYYQEKYTMAVSRAVAKLDFLIKVAMPLLKKDGILIVQKGKNVSEEILTAQNILDEKKAIIEKIVSISIPFVDCKRTILLIRKRV